MKLGFVADVHFQGGVLLPVIAKAWAQGFEVFDQEGVDVVYVVGDLHESPSLALGRDGTAGDVQAAVLGPLTRFLSKRPSRKVVVLVGNHDIAGPGHLSSVEYLRHLPGVEVVDTPRMLEHDGILVGCLPWAWNTNLLRSAGYRAMSSQRFAEVAAELRHQMLLGFAAQWADHKGLRVLAGHAEVDGAQNRYTDLPPGETHVFSLHDLKATGADVLAFGHYHKRQMDCYIGALVQLSFGEEGDPTGVAVLGEDGRMVFHEIDCPRHFTVTAEQAKVLEHRRGFDRVKVRYNDKSELEGLDLDESTCTTEKVPQKKAARTARAEGISVESTLGELLDAWLKERPQEAVTREALDRELNEMLKAVTLPPPAASAGVGLKAIRQVRLRNIGPHRDTVLEVGQDGLMAVVGPNGSGKTTLLEAVPACFYGEFPWYPGSLYDRMTKGHVGDSLLSVTFEAGASTYRAERKMRTTAKTQKTECYLNELLPDGSEGSIAGPKEADFSSAVRRLVGDKEFFFATVFQSQGDVGSLIDADPCDRMEFARKWVGADRFSVAHQWAKTEANAAQQGILSDQALVARLREEAAAADGHRRDLGEAQEKKLRAEANVAEAEERRKALEQELNRLRADSLARDEIVRQVSEAENTVRRLKGEVEFQERQIAADESELLREEHLRSQVSILLGLREELSQAKRAEEALAAEKARRNQVAAEVSDLDNQVAASVEAARQKVEARGRELGAEIRGAENELAGAIRESVAQASATRSEIQRKAEEVRGRIDVAVANARAQVEAERAKQRTIIANANGALEVKRLGLQEDVRRVKQQHGQWEAKSRLLESAGCRPNRLPCPFIDDARGAPDELQKLKVTLDRVETDLAFDDYGNEERAVLEAAKVALQGLIDPDPESVATDLRADLARLRLDWKAVTDPDPETIRPDLRARLVMRRSELSALAPPPPETVALELREKAREARARLEAMPEPARAGRQVSSIEREILDLGNPEQGLGRLVAVREGLVQKRETLARAKADVAAAESRASEENARLSAVPSLQFAIGAKEADIVLQEGEVSTARSEVGLVERTLGAVETKIAACEKSAREADEKEKALTPKSDRARALGVLSEFLGPTGIPQILIDSALVPQVNEILCEMTDAMEDPITIEFSTQRELKTGGVREGLYINVADEYGIRDIKEHSYGEQGMQRKLVRQALGLFGAMRQGQHHSVYCVDEPTLGLDAKNVPRLLGVIFKIAQRFRQVWVISHDPALLVGIPYRFTLKRQNGATRVELDGALDEVPSPEEALVKWAAGAAKAA